MIKWRLYKDIKGTHPVNVINESYLDIKVFERLIRGEFINSYFLNYLDDLEFEEERKIKYD